MEDPNSPIAGMPVLEVWKAQKCDSVQTFNGSGLRWRTKPIILQRENTQMLFGDAKIALKIS